MRMRLVIRLKEAQKLAREHGMSIRKTSGGDYRVAFIGDKDTRAVYEDTVSDALDTAQVMYNRYIKKTGHFPPGNF